MSGGRYDATPSLSLISGVLAGAPTVLESSQDRGRIFAVSDPVGFGKWDLLFYHFHSGWVSLVSGHFAGEAE
jgi:hypothetical protein